MSFLAIVGLTTESVAEDVDFYVLNDPDYTEPLKELISRLPEDWRLELKPQAGYEAVIESLAKAKGQRFLAHTTPYVFAVTEMLGVDVRVLATYKSEATNRVTYDSYFVVNRDALDTTLERTASSAEPDERDLLEYLRRIGRTRPATFIYHSKFSTSSYFQPSLFFREHRIVAIPPEVNYEAPGEDSDSIWIKSHKIPRNSSSELVRWISKGEGDREADFAAVWDSPKMAIERHEEVPPVYFIKYSYELPNDMIVCANLSADEERRLRNQLVGVHVNPIHMGDFAEFVSVETPMLQALARLRHDATQLLTVVVAKIVWEGGEDTAKQTWETAARTALRIAGPEFIEYDEAEHDNYDVRWSLRPLHDGAVVLESTIAFDTSVEAQEVVLSDPGEDGHEQRILTFMRERMHRISEIWPYRGEATIFRNFDVDVGRDSIHKVVPITWNDRLRNNYAPGRPFEARVCASDPYKIELCPGPFNQKFDPLGPTTFRVILLRPDHENRLFRALTVVLLVVFVLAAIAALFDLRRRLERG